MRLLKHECSWVASYLHTVWPENLTGIKFDEIASKLYNKNMTDFKFDEMPGKKA